ncbi:MAG: transglycosylase SLT domain-containing protein [Candidatus Moranbacteria bacterium]|nr:transglycosylase SLT domain-containing protein [Candidatus Moranbacteria bacterium]
MSLLFKKKFFVILFFLFFSFLPDFSWAAKETGGLVPCAGDSIFENRCTLCDLMVGMKGIIDWGMKILVVVALVAIVAGGIMYIISAGNSGMMESAKTVIKQALWGVVIVLGAWVIVNTILWMITSRLFAGDGTTNGSFMDIGSWYDFDCRTVTGGTTPGELEISTVPRNPDGTCPAGYQLTSGGLSCTPEDGQESPPEETTEDNLPMEGIPEACNKYDANFKAAATSSGGSYSRDTDCLLRSIAATESGCNPGLTSPAGSVGIMQFKPSTAKKNEDFLKANPEWSISKAAEYLRENQNQIDDYKYFNASDGNAPGTKTVKYPDGKGGFDTYYVGNDDLIASYNAGAGESASSADKLGPFVQTVACRDRDGYPSNLPAWQCPYRKADSNELEEDGPKDNKGFTETRDYVQKVQGYQRGCLGN